MKRLWITPLIITMFLNALSNENRNVQLQKATIIGDLDTMLINNIFLPYENNGSTADDSRAYYPNGTNLSFLFQGGLAMTGYVGGELRASWMAKSEECHFSPGYPKRGIESASWGSHRNSGKRKN